MVTTILFILGAVVANMALGAVWYMPKTFGTMWMKDAKVNPSATPKKAMVRAMVVSAVCYAVLATVLWSVQYILGFAELRYFLTGIVLMWLGFVLCIRLTHAMFEGKSIRYVAITAGHDLVSLLLTGSIVYASLRPTVM